MKAVRTILILLLGLPIALALPGCEDESEEMETKDDRVMVSRGIINASMSRYIDAGMSAPVEQFGLMGMFARYDVERSRTVDILLGSSVADINLDMDSCTPPEAVFEGAPRVYPVDETTIELLDVGNLSVSYEHANRPVPTRTFPDLLKVIVGVIYATDESKGVLFNPGVEYTIKAMGTDEVEPFRVTLEAPDELGDITVNGTLPEDRMPLIVRGETVDLTWEGSGGGDEIIATFSAISMGTPWTMTCRMRDDGEFSIPARLTEALPDPLTVSDEEMMLSRVRQMTFRSEGLSSGSFKFEISTNFPVEL